MTNPAKVTGFLDFFGHWNASLAFVMIGAIGVHATLHRAVTRRPTPVFGDRFHLPTRRDVDPRLLIGSAIFGLGWGLGGYCPGPGIVSLASGSRAAVAFVLAMSAGMLIYRRAFEGK
jgi:hypothetical protein